jgi:hypothetical protein
VRRGAAPLALLAVLELACGPFGAVTVTAPPPRYEPPVPERFGGKAAPLLLETDAPGLLRAPSVDEHLYYYRPDDLWYRFAFNRWYQAFAWNGNWFVPEKVPDVLRGREPRRSFPTLPGLEAPEEGEEEL